MVEADELADLQVGDASLCDETPDESWADVEVVGGAVDVEEALGHRSSELRGIWRVLVMPIESARPLGTRHGNEPVRSGGAASRRTPGRTFRRTHGAVRADHELRATHAHRASWNQRSDWFERSMSSIVDLVTALVVALAQDDRSCLGDPGRHSRGGACGDKARSFSSWCSVRLAWMRASALWRFQRNLQMCLDFVSGREMRSTVLEDASPGAVAARQAAMVGSMWRGCSRWSR